MNQYTIIIDFVIDYVFSITAKPIRLHLHAFNNYKNDRFILSLLYKHIILLHKIRHHYYVKHYCNFSKLFSFQWFKFNIKDDSWQNLLQSLAQNDSTNFYDRVTLKTCTIPRRYLNKDSWPRFMKCYVICVIIDWTLNFKLDPLCKFKKN